MDFNKNKYGILFLLHLPPPVHGSSVVGGFIKESKLINETFNCTFLNVLASTSVSKTGKVSLNKIFGLIITIYKLVKNLIQNRPRLCYLALTTTGAAFFKDALFVMVIKLFSVKRIYHLHNKGVALHKHKYIYKVIYKFVFRDADVILLSNLLYSDISNFVALDRIHLCPNGIPSHLEKKKIIKENNTVCNILFLSNLIESKGVYTLLKACEILKNDQQNFICRLIGSEGDISKEKLNSSIAAMKLSNFVVYEGVKYGIDKHNTFSNADIFVFPTYYQNECFPLVLLEAMNYSLPIISTTEGGISDIVIDGENGFLTKPKDEKRIAEKFQLLIKNEVLRTTMGAAGKKKYLEEFTLEIFEQRLSFILHKCILK